MVPATRSVRVLARGDAPYRDLAWHTHDGRLGYVRERALHFMRPGAAPSAPVNRAPVRRFVGWNARGDRFAYVSPERTAPTPEELWTFLLAPVEDARDVVYVSDPGGTQQRVFEGMRVTFPRWSPEDDRLSLSMDVLAPEGYGEIIGGGERSPDLALLEEQIERHGLPREAFEWYLDLRRYGSVPHGGFGLGIERTVGWICGSPHVRETIPFPRMMYRTYP